MIKTFEEMIALSQVKDRIREAYVPLVEEVFNDFWQVKQKAPKYIPYPMASIDVTYGRRYAKVRSAKSVHSFIDLRNGDILKAASYAQPALNGVRGNIFSDDAGRSVIDWHGTKYLK